MDPVTAFLTFATAFMNYQTARLAAMTPAQKEQELQLQIDAGTNISKDWQTLTQNVIDVFYPAKAA
jgi:hypothetical protein